MPAINITDLNNAKTDVDHIAEIATSPAPTAIDRLANTKKTIAGVNADAAARLAANDARELAAFNTRNSTEATAFTGRNSLEATTFNARNSTAAAQVSAIQAAADAVIGNIAGITNRGAWAPATLYAGKDIVLNAGTWYICVVAHTSSAAFATDTASKWRVYQGVNAADLAAADGVLLVGNAADKRALAGPDGVLAVGNAADKRVLAADKLRGAVSVDDFFIAGEPDYQAAIVRAIAAARTVRFPSAGTYNVNITAHGSILVPDSTTLDLMGSTIKDIGAPSPNCHIFKNATHGVTVNFNITFKNGTIAGCGSNNNVQDQGHAIALWKTQNVTISDIRLKDTAGDGLGAREAYDTTLRRLRVGNFGRNAISPTSGSFYWDDVICDGFAFTGATPGAYIDAENNSSTETSLHRMTKVKAGNITFVDFYAGPDFNHDVIMTNCEFGTADVPAFNAIRVLNKSATALKTAKNFIIGSGVKLYAFNGNCINLEKVAGVRIVGKPVLAGVNSKGVAIFGLCDDITLDAAFGAGITYQLSCFADGVDILTNSKISGLSGPVYLQGSGNTFKNSVIPVLTLKNAVTSSNTFAIDAQVGTVVYLTGAGLLQPPIYRSVYADIPTPSGPYVLDIPVPTAAVKGKVYRVLAGWTHEGRVLHYAQCDVVVGMGVNTLGILQTISNTASAGHGFVVSCPNVFTIRLTLTYSFGGGMSATVIG